MRAAPGGGCDGNQGGLQWIEECTRGEAGKTLGQVVPKAHRGMSSFRI